MTTLDVQVVDRVKTTEWFSIKTTVKQICNLSGLLLMLVVDWILRRTLQGKKMEIHEKNWKILTLLMILP